MEDITYIDDFIDAEDEDKLFEPPAKRRCGPNRKWTKTEEFKLKEEAEKFISSTWKKTSQKTTREGLKTEYRCTAGQYRTNECPTRLYLLYHVTNMRVSLFRCDADHVNHSHVPKQGLTAEDKLFVREKFEEGITKPNALLDLFQKENRGLNLPEVN